MFEQWSDFNVAMAGATAALAGLVIVASSVNIADIIKSRSLTARLLASIAALLLALVASALALVPEIEPAWYGWLLVASTLAAAVFQVNAARLIAGDPDSPARAKPLKYLVGFLPLLAYLAAGILLWLGLPTGLHLLAAGCLLAIVSAIVVSWVALVEVLR